MNKGENSLTEHIILRIANAAQRYPQIETVALFGSWALGNAKSGSDIDLALFGKEVDIKTVTSFHMYLEEETTIPHLFDVVHFESLDNIDLKEHIIDVGRTIYAKEDAGKENRFD